MGSVCVCVGGGGGGEGVGGGGRGGRGDTRAGRQVAAKNPIPLLNKQKKQTNKIIIESRSCRGEKEKRKNMHCWHFSWSAPDNSSDAKGLALTASWLILTSQLGTIIRTLRLSYSVDENCSHFFTVTLPNTSTPNKSVEAFQAHTPLYLHNIWLYSSVGKPLLFQIDTNIWLFLPFTFCPFFKLSFYPRKCSCILFTIYLIPLKSDCILWDLKAIKI